MRTRKQGKTMTSLRALVLATVGALLTACALSPFEASWKAPEATPLQLKGAKVAAIAMIEDDAARRTAEDALVRELAARGAKGVPMYTIMPGAAPGNETEVRSALDGMAFAGAVVLRPFDKRTEVVAEPIFAGQHVQLWDGYYTYGWKEPWRVAVVADVRTRTLVSVEILVYSLRQNRLVWAGRTTTTDPGSVERFVETTARSVARELTHQGLLPAS
jgi:hypothetical protein